MNRTCKNWLNFCAFVVGAFDIEYNFSSEYDIQVVKIPEGNGMALGVDFGNEVPKDALALSKSLEDVTAVHGFSLKISRGTLVDGYVDTSIDDNGGCLVLYLDGNLDSGSFPYTPISLKMSLSKMALDCLSCLEDNIIDIFN